MNNILLSVCIPTYNRSGYLRRALESIAVQLADNEDLLNKVEVVVSDNCSTDDTAEAAKSFESKIKNLTYTKNATNVGFDMNSYNVVSKASGKYCWYLGDDDMIANGGIELMCKTIENDEYDFIGVNTKPEEDNKDYLNKKDLDIKTNIIVDEFNDYYFKGYCQGGVSALAFNRQAWLNESNVNDFLQHWLYYETVLKILVSTKKKLVFIDEKVVLTGQDCRWAENGTELFTFTNSNILLEKMIIFGFDKTRIEAELQKNTQKILIILLRAKSNNLKCNFKNLAYVRKNLKRLSLPYFIIVAIVFFIPNPIIKVIKKVKKLIVR